MANEYIKSGLLNVFDKKIIRNEYNYHKTSLIDSIVKSRKNNYNPRIKDEPNEYVGVVLRSDGKFKIPPNHILYDFYSNLEENAQLEHIKVRIPEVHIGHPIPTSPFDKSIDLYPTFIAENSSLESPPIGTLVKVKFLDAENLLYPIYIAPLNGGSGKVLGDSLKGIGTILASSVFDDDPCNPNFQLGGDKIGEKIMPVQEPIFNDKILYNNGSIDINWTNFVINSEWLLLKGWRKPRKERTPNSIVLHWDATLSAKSARRILEKRSISTHFIIDNDGTIYQLVDVNNISYHSGISAVNSTSIAIDFSDAVYLKYQKRYEKKYGPRPIWKWRGKINHLGFYDVQLEAAKVLIDTLCNKFNIPKIAAEGTKYDPKYATGDFKGIMGHYHCKKGKWDPGGLNFEDIL